ncbi:MAG: hypothetical protein U1E39_00725 [Planctomycetota bacterium]
MGIWSRWIVIVATASGLVGSSRAASAEDAPVDPPSPLTPPLALRPGVLPAHQKSVCRECPAPTCEVVKRVSREIEVPTYGWKLIDTFVTVEQRVARVVKRPPTMAVRVRAPEAEGLCDPPATDPEADGRRVAQGVCQPRRRSCTPAEPPRTRYRVVQIPIPGAAPIPQVEIRVESVRLPAGKQWQWVQTGTTKQTREVEEVTKVPIPGAAPTRVTELIDVPCEVVTVIDDPVPALSGTELEVYRASVEPYRLERTRRVLTRSEFAAARAAIERANPSVERRDQYSETEAATK